MAQIQPRILAVQNRPARVWRGGTGPALLLLHGEAGDAELCWQAVWEALSASFTLAAPDLPGFGGTTPLPAASFSAFVEWTAALLETLGFPRAVVVGHSLGASLARLYAAAYPIRVTRLILVDGGSIPRPPALARSLLALPHAGDWLVKIMRRRAFSRAGLQKLVADERLITPDFAARSRAASEGFVRATRQAAFGPLPDRQTPASPTLVLWGELDRHSPLPRARALEAEIPGARLQPLPAAGHLPQLEQPTAFVAAVRAFCLQR